MDKGVRHAVNKYNRLQKKKKKKKILIRDKWVNYLIVYKQII